MNPWRVLSLAADPMRGRNPEMRFMSQYRNFAGRWGKNAPFPHQEAPQTDVTFIAEQRGSQALSSCATVSPIALTSLLRHWRMVNWPLLHFFVAIPPRIV